MVTKFETIACKFCQETATIHKRVPFHVYPTIIVVQNNLNARELIKHTLDIPYLPALNVHIQQGCTDER